jgi:hypothetical protein
MEESPSYEANSHLATQEITQLLWCPTGPPLASILIQMHQSTHSQPTSPRYNLILPSHLRPIQQVMCHISFQSSLIFLDFPDGIF